MQTNHSHTGRICRLHTLVGSPCDAVWVRFSHIYCTVAVKPMALEWVHLHKCTLTYERVST